MIGYLIANKPNEAKFENMCDVIEGLFPMAVKGMVLCDVDGSKFRTYKTGRGTIIVKNSYYEGDLYIEADLELPIECIRRYEV